MHGAQAPTTLAKRLYVPKCFTVYFLMQTNTPSKKSPKFLGLGMFCHSESGRVTISCARQVAQGQTARLHDDSIVKLLFHGEKNVMFCVRSACTRTPPPPCAEITTVLHQLEKVACCGGIGKSFRVAGAREACRSLTVYLFAHLEKLVAS